MVTTTKEMVTTKPEYYLTSTVHATSNPKGRHLTIESAVTKSMTTHVVTEMGSSTSQPSHCTTIIPMS